MRTFRVYYYHNLSKDGKTYIDVEAVNFPDLLTKLQRTLLKEEQFKNIYRIERV